MTSTNEEAVMSGRTALFVIAVLAGCTNGAEPAPTPRVAPTSDELAMVEKRDDEARAQAAANDTSRPLTADELKISAWTDCVSAAGKHFATRSREAAQAVVQAAFGSCKMEEIRVEFAWGERSTNAMRQTISDRVMREIVEKRSK